MELVHKEDTHGNVKKNESTKAEIYQYSNIRFADDTKIFRRISTKKDEEILQEDINEMLKWATSHKLVEQSL